jgi:hypothetical protein
MDMKLLLVIVYAICITLAGIYACCKSKITDEKFEEIYQKVLKEAK